MPGTQNALSEVAYLRRSCDYLLSALRDVERELGRLPDLTDAQETILDMETSLAGEDIRKDLDHAASSAESWLARIENVRNL
ncbi:hypothetical protein OG806_08260 [Streptomyces sp. NBC_00882]|uniref:hypothetical protein n=1 Tax=Streptomyces sp. NBC_00882 TaxID=2975856 RepID=UPI003870E535|nr:hypothetical protein OG806_08260 [Streptomyces sp. NBC_00882]